MVFQLDPGHDFGAMYGALLAASDPRVKILAFQAGTSSFSNWFLYTQQKLSPEGKQSVVSRLAPLDPGTLASFDIELLARLPQLALPTQDLFASTGSVHAAVAFDTGGSVVLSRALPSFSVIEIWPVSATRKFAPVMPMSAST